MTVEVSMGTNTPTTSPASSTFADWQAVPHHAPDAAARKAAEQCISELEPHGSKFPNLGFKPSDALLSEQRGRTMYTVLANSASFGTCLTLDGRSDGGGSWNTPHGYPHPSATAISVGENGSSWTMDIHNKRVDTTMLAGFAGSTVTGITIRRTDGVVAASVNDGLWAA